ncbi:hypothetical protein KKC36_00065 [Patescibacteria group bacterium]|nr:hypothetical protein [Patescibacteria group bacterium]
MSLTQRDLNAIKDLIGITIDEAMGKKLDEKLSKFLTKEEFFNRMDEVMSELKIIREETTVLTHQVSNHEDRITKAEDKLSIQTS